MRASDLYPRLRSLRSLSLGLLESQPLRGCEVSIQRVVSDGCRVRPLWPSVINSIFICLRTATRAAPCSRRSDTDILFSVWSLTVPCKRITFACTSSPRHWVETILSSVHRLRSLSLGLLESQPLRGCEVSIQRVVSDGCRARLGRVRGRPS